MNKSGWVVKSFATTLLIVILTTLALAQAGTSTVTGTVTDPQGNAVAEPRLNSLEYRGPLERR